MSEYDAELYERFSQSVRRQVTSFKVILDNLQVNHPDNVCEEIVSITPGNVNLKSTNT